MNITKCQLFEMESERGLVVADAQVWHRAPEEIWAEVKRSVIAEQRRFAYLHRIWVMPRYRKQGIATRLLNEVIKHYDEIETHLILRVDPFVKGGCSKEQLFKFYRGYGFARRSRPRTDVMIRFCQLPEKKHG